MCRNGLVKVAFIALAWTASAAYTQEKRGGLPDSYPTRPIRVLVGVSPGGGLDSITRLVAQKLGERLGQTFIVDNRPGATSTIAMNLAASASPDGYTLMSATKTMILNGALKKVPYDVLKTFAPIAPMSTQVYVMVVNPSLPVTSIRDLLSHAKAKPGRLNYGSAGLGSLQHVGMELFNSMTGANIVHVPYKGGGAALIDLLSGQIQVMPSVTISVGPHLKSGKLRAIAVTGAQRVRVLPNVPTVSESGVPGFELTNMYSIYAPAGTAPALVSMLNREISRIMKLPDLSSMLAADGVEAAAPATPQEFKETVSLELSRWEKFLKQSKLRL